MGRWLAALPLVALAACQPPAAEDYLERGKVTEALPQASAPLPSPDTTGAVWAPSDIDERLLYGVPGETPLLAFQCERGGAIARLAFTRFAPADREAQAMMAVVGNFHALRLPVDSTYNGRAWLWQGSVEADHPDLEAMTGQKEFEATIPGAGSVELKPSPLVRSLVNACRATPEDEEPDEDAEPAR
ncbi:hypothetical protein [Parerythrobacter aestuarii]|uniref:hypothetical protein n=1 Tax=Parerythrobacter aestuarii TaxID=3020909 RepID=UPI0024DEED8C|nr:hypothetical protein [Parerythrobacter aestuarii]